MQGAFLWGDPGLVVSAVRALILELWPAVFPALLGFSYSPTPLIQPPNNVTLASSGDPETTVLW